MYNYIKTQTGRSMIEMLGVLAIIGVLSIGGITGYYIAMQKYKVDTAINDINHIVISIRNLYFTQGNVVGLSPAILEKNKIIEKSRCYNEDCSGTSIISIFKEKIDINYAEQQEIWIDMTIPKNACVPLITANWGNTSTGFTGAQVIGYPDMLTPPVSIEDASKACSVINEKGDISLWFWLFEQGQI